ncbi:unnamed protein product [Gulo gulo]|uniref:Uncharacterized protein n=1 Tax=Gulo gulo TaxID=48420 RepID=A0A9X9MAQ6_GULGU|nr:unnamed protein product [Gulo gulo]
MIVLQMKKLNSERLSYLSRSPASKKWLSDEHFHLLACDSVFPESITLIIPYVCLDAVLNHFLHPYVFSHFHTALDDACVCCVPQCQVHSEENHSWRTAQRTLPATSPHVDTGPIKAFRKGRTSFSRPV